MKARMTIEDLAAMVQKGFDDLEQGINQRFATVEGRFEILERRLGSLEQGQEDIKLRLGEAAYRFELVELQHRVGKIEHQIGMKQ